MITELKLCLVVLKIIHLFAIITERDFFFFDTVLLWDLQLD